MCSIISSIQRSNTILRHISIIHFLSSIMAEHKIHMIHRSIDFNTVTRHTLYIDICITWINIIPFSTNLYSITEVNLTKISRLTKHRCLRIKSNTNHINNVIFINIKITIVIIIQFFRSLPVF